MNKSVIKIKEKLVFSIIPIVLGLGFLLCQSLMIRPMVLASAKENALEDRLENAEEEKAKAQQRLNAAQSSLSATQAQVQTTQVLIDQTENSISTKEEELEKLKKKIDMHKEFLQNYLLEMYYGDNEAEFEFIMNGGDLNQVVDNFSHISSTEEKVVMIMDEINDVKSEVHEIKEDLEEKKEGHEELLEKKQAEQQELKGAISSTQATISELNAKINKMRSELASLLGDNITAKDIVEAAEVASKATGVSKDFILGMLVVETDLGRYTGGCYYKESKMGSSNSAIFKDICERLDYDYKKKKVSCPLSYGIGGAMGVAQFMPTTWSGYEARIAAATGHKNPDPWSLVDGVMAMALYLDNKGGDSKKGERTAAAAYYCGSNLSRSVCQNYADKVLYWADNYEKKL